MWVAAHAWRKKNRPLTASAKPITMAKVRSFGEPVAASIQTRTAMTTLAIAMARDARGRSGLGRSGRGTLTRPG